MYMEHIRKILSLSIPSSSRLHVPPSLCPPAPAPSLFPASSPGKKIPYWKIFLDAPCYNFEVRQTRSFHFRTNLCKKSYEIEFRINP